MCSYIFQNLSQVSVHIYVNIYVSNLVSNSVKISCYKICLLTERSYKMNYNMGRWTGGLSVDLWYFYSPWSIFYELYISHKNIPSKNYNILKGHISRQKYCTQLLEMAPCPMDENGPKLFERLNWHEIDKYTGGHLFSYPLFLGKHFDCFNHFSQRIQKQMISHLKAKMF